MPEKPESEKRYTATWEIESRRENVDPKIQELEELLKALGWSEEEIHLFPVATGEALANAVIHGNLALKKKEGERLEDYEVRVAEAERSPLAEEKKVRVKLDLSENEATVSISDEGEWADAKGVPDPKTGERLLEPSGRGIEIMRAACDEARFFPGKVVLYKKRKSRADTK